MGLLSAGQALAQEPQGQPDAPLTAAEMPQQWRYEPAFDGPAPGQGDQWWRSFGDPVLDTLVARGLDNNYDVLTAARRMEIARQTLNEVRSQYFPSLNLSGAWNRSRTSGATVSPHTPAATASAFTLGVDMSWQIDLFGKITSAARQSAAALRVSRAYLAGAQLTLCGDIAAAYMQLRTLQAEDRVAQDHLASQKRVLEIARARHEAGLASALDVLQASTVYYSTRATIPGLETAIATTANALDVLTGAMPGGTPPAPAPMPGYRAIVGAGVPMELLRRRPDIIAAEAQLAAAAAAVGIAKKDFLPTLTLDGSVGTASHRLDGLFKNNSLTYSIAPTLSWTLFEGMKRNYALAAAREQMLMQIDAYNLTVLTAVKEVDNAMTTYVNTCRQVEMLADVVEQARKSVELSVDLYRSGLSGFTDVANAQMNYLTYSDSYIQAQGKALAALINIHEALGGGFSL